MKVLEQKQNVLTDQQNLQRNKHRARDLCLWVPVVEDRGDVHRF